jgi:DNA-binding transcriptional LysR family regulator
MNQGGHCSGAIPSLREFEVLHAVLRHGSAGAAARSLRITQPAVSRTIALLEKRLGRRLFDRRANALLPRPEALALDEGAQAIIGALGRLVQGVEATARAPLTLVTTTTLAQAFVAPRLPAIMAAWPELALQVEIASSAAVLTAVADGAADLGLLDQFTGYDSISAVPLHRGPAAVAIPKGHPLASAPIVGLPELAALPLIALPRRFPLRAALDRAFRVAGLVPQVVLEAATSLFAAEMVQAGIGVAVLNPFPLAAHLPGLTFCPLALEVVLETALLLPGSVPPSPPVARVVAQLLGDHGAAGGAAASVLNDERTPRK